MVVDEKTLKKIEEICKIASDSKMYVRVDSFINNEERFEFLKAPKINTNDYGKPYLVSKNGISFIKTLSHSGSSFLRKVFITFDVKYSNDATVCIDEHIRIYRTLYKPSTIKGMINHVFNPYLNEL